VLIQDMTREMSLSLIESSRYGRIACAKEGQPYVTPLSYAYSTGYLYCFSTVGTRIEWMRVNPLVCVEIEDLVSLEEWRTVVIFGLYHELTDTPEFYEERRRAYDLLAVGADWWNPGYAKTVRHGAERPLEPVYFRIAINEISGHQGIPDTQPKETIAD
jgi:nitroimidazol reductase NimA-like FMN-containing flavoprotein (pyridoxamine 5'-phosphate oxidase superfamily)